jgi:hypothetical protein
MDHHLLPRWLLLLSLLLAGCGDTRDGGTGGMCTSGATEPCSCAGGTLSVRRCVGGAFGVCECMAFGGDASTCAPECGERTCGPDPRCGVSCGDCTGTCMDGRCMGSASGPRILSWAVSSMVLTPSRSILATAVVTDPDGIDDILGGTLVDAEGRAYGTFTSSGGAGSYSVTLTWSGVHSVVPINGPGGLVRRLTARFFDVVGNRVDQSFDVTLQCDDSSLSPCSGTCVDVQRSLHHCGRCGFGCASPDTISSSADYCNEGDCIHHIPTFDPNQHRTCAERCAAQGHVCDPARGGITDLGFASYPGCSDSYIAITSCSQAAPAMRVCGGATVYRDWFECNCWRDDPWSGD